MTAVLTESAVLTETAPAGPSVPSSAAAAAATVAEALPGAGLDEVLAAAELQTRTDRKYLVPVREFTRLGAELEGTFHVLQISEHRTFRYESVYFDTAELMLYRQHLQGRRRRYKVRTRTYLDTNNTTFEIKLKGSRGQTIKSRRPHDMTDRRTMTQDARAFLDELLEHQYGAAAPELAPSVTTSYSRTTLVDLTLGARLTCDVDLVCSAAMATSGETLIGHVLVETKTDGAGSLADLVLRDLGVRPVRMSKYCVGVALLNPDVPANPWYRTLRRHFGYRAAGAG